MSEELMQGKEYTETQLVERMCQLTALTENDVRWLLEWIPELFEGCPTLDSLSRFDASYGYGIQVYSEEELSERFGEYADADGVVREVPDAGVTRDAGLSGVLLIYGFAG